MQSTPLTFARFSGNDRHTTRKPSFQRSEDMARNFKELYDKMPKASRERVEERVKEFHHAMALDDIRRARKLTQVEVAEKLGVDQGAVSKIEKRSDVYVSTLRKQIEAMGGSLELRAVFPDAALDVRLGATRTRAKTLTLPPASAASKRRKAS
jgi:ribosome-binding protein aMBF1 (putative translation factor)